VTADKKYPPYDPESGYMTDVVRSRYIESAIQCKLLPAMAHRLPQVVSLNASESQDKPILIWQLYSVLGENRIRKVVSRFYDRVFADEIWFTSVFERVGDKNRHILTQSAMWIDVMGGGHQYHGGEFRVNFHHTHNALELMNTRGAERWVKLMNQTLDEPDLDLTDDQRVRPAINTFLAFFIDKYAEDFDFKKGYAFGETNPAFKQRINFMKMSEDEIAMLPEEALREELSARRIDVSQYPDKIALVNKALSL